MSRPVVTVHQGRRLVWALRPAGGTDGSTKRLWLPGVIITNEESRRYWKAEILGNRVGSPWRRLTFAENRETNIG